MLTTVYAAIYFGTHSHWAVSREVVQGLDGSAIAFHRSSNAKHFSGEPSLALPSSCYSPASTNPRFSKGRTLWHFAFILCSKAGALRFCIEKIKRDFGFPSCLSSIHSLVSNRDVKCFQRREKTVLSFALKKFQGSHPMSDMCCQSVWSNFPELLFDF